MARLPRGIRRSTGETLFTLGNTLFLVLVSAVCLFPFLHEAARSLSTESAIVTGKVTVWPVGFHLRAYKTVFENTGMNQALRFTVTLTVLGTIVNLFVTTIGAYPLSKRRLLGRRGIWLFILITMFFNGGLIPRFLVVRSVGLLDRI